MEADTPGSPKREKKKLYRGISKSFYFFTIAITVVIGFVAGTRSNELLGAIAPVLGIRVETSTLDLSPVQKTYQELKLHYDGDLDEKKLIEGASRGLVEAVDDDYTTYLDPKEAIELEKDLSGNIGGGIGAEIGVREGRPTILRVLEGNPAEKAGVKAGDTIIGVNEQSAEGWTADKAAGKIRGEPGTTVKLAVLREAEPKEFVLTRAIINNPSVSSTISNGLGILTIRRFDNETAGLARKIALRFKQENVKGVILDLRGNGGGYLAAAPDLAELWLRDKVIVSQRSGGKVIEELRSGNDTVLEGMPTVVLVNGSTASASEIVAGALQEYEAAVLIGEETFGKGTVQKLLSLEGGAKLKVTIARWYTPQGKNITKEGISPDKVVELTAKDADAKRDPQLEAAEQYVTR